MLKNPPWLWQGTWGEIESPIRALLLAPLFSLLPAIPWILSNIVRGSAQFESIFFFSGFILLIAYGTTLAIGIPWFLILSRIGYGGLIPVASSSIVPLIMVYALQRMNPQANFASAYLLFLACGITVSTAFWKLARTPYDGPEKDWGEKIHALTKRFSCRAP